MGREIRATWSMVMAVLLLGYAALVSAEATPAAKDDASAKADAGTGATATFAGGCFWCMEPPFDALPGVLSTTSGYTGGRTERPTYEAVSAGVTGHAESIQVVYDPSRISYEKLLDVFWRNVDPTTPQRQFCDVGTQYRTAIFYHDAEQKRAAEQSKEALAKSGRLREPIVTEIVPAGPFYPAEEYHQDYYRKNPLRYKFYRYNCGRDKRLKELWGDEAGGGSHAQPEAKPAG